MVIVVDETEGRATTSRRGAPQARKTRARLTHASRISPTACSRCGVDEMSRVTFARSPPSDGCRAAHKVLPSAGVRVSRGTSEGVRRASLHWHGKQDLGERNGSQSVFGFLNPVEYCALRCVASDRRSAGREGGDPFGEEPPRKSKARPRTAGGIKASTPTFMRNT